MFEKKIDRSHVFYPKMPRDRSEYARDKFHEILCAALRGGMGYADAKAAAEDQYGSFVREREADDRKAWDEYYEQLKQAEMETKKYPDAIVVYPHS